MKAEKCSSCPAMLDPRDDLSFTCDSCMREVCPTCAKLGPSDVDDPMPKVAECPCCIQDNERDTEHRAEQAYLRKTGAIL